MAALSRDATAATTSPSAAADTADSFAAGSDAEFVVASHEPVMFCVHDAKLGEVSILQGTNEVVVKDPQLVRRIMHAASRQNL